MLTSNEKVWLGIGLGTAALAGAAPVVGFVMTQRGIEQAEAATRDGVDPSQRARLLADGIGGAMDWTVYSLVAFGVLGVVSFGALLVFSSAWYARRKEEKEREGG